MKIVPINILLVEDNEGDILVTTEALEEAEISKSLKVIRDGASTLLYLKEAAEKFLSELLDLILLDINLPKKNGCEVLMDVKSNSLLKHIPAIKLTTSSSDADELKCYQEHAKCYLIKPLEVSQFLQMLERIEDFWLNMVQLRKLN